MTREHEKMFNAVVAAGSESVFDCVRLAAELERLEAIEARQCTPETCCAAVKAALLDPACVWTNMLRGTIAMPNHLKEMEEKWNTIVLQAQQGRDLKAESEFLAEIKAKGISV